MKFGLYSSIADPPRGEHLARAIDEVTAEAQLAESLGSIFFGEHHQDKDGFLPSPLIVATAVAARTTRLRVGTSVILRRSITRSTWRKMSRRSTIDALAPDRLILGDSETCVRELTRWREASGAEYVLLRLRHAHSGGPAHAEIMKAIRLFGERVLPSC